jgi:hypothetical protein
MKSIEFFLKAMRKVIYLVAVFLLSSQILCGQVVEGEKDLRKQTTAEEKGWNTGAVFSLNVSQTSLTNWAAGGQNSFGINGLASLYANYGKGNISWDNSLDVGYGVLQQGAKTPFLKTDDRFDLLSKFGRKASEKWYYAALLNFKTQMTPGWDYKKDPKVKISNLLAPAYVLGAVGADYKPNKYFSAFLSPVTGKMTIVNDTTLSKQGAFGVKKGEVLKGEFGGYVRAAFTKNDFTQELLKNVSLTSKLDLFSNYLYRPQDVDVSWENIIALQLNKYITVNLNTHLIYDADILFDTDNDGIPDKTKVQFKEILGVGFMVKF